MDNIRKEFESWINSEMGVDCGNMQFEQSTSTGKWHYVDETDPNGALAVSAMLVAWRASRDVRRLELNEVLQKKS